jgi:hypothetical protein
MVSQEKIRATVEELSEAMQNSEICLRRDTGFLSHYDKVRMRKDAMARNTRN